MTDDKDVTVDEPVVEAARLIRAYLPDLVAPDAATELDGRIADLLAALEAGEDSSGELRSLLGSHSATRDFMSEVLADAPHFRPPQFQVPILRDLGYQPLPGTPLPMHAGKFACPHGDYVWYRPGVGVPIPVCPTHDVVLIRLP